MITNSERAAVMPARSAAPYPGVGTSTSRAPRRAAICWDPSVLPLSATMTSPVTPSSCMARWAFSTQQASVSASLRQGNKTVSSGGEPPGSAGADRVSTSTMERAVPG